MVAEITNRIKSRPVFIDGTLHLVSNLHKIIGAHAPAINDFFKHQLEHDKLNIKMRCTILGYYMEGLSETEQKSAEIGEQLQRVLNLFLNEELNVELFESLDGDFKLKPLSKINSVLTHPLMKTLLKEPE